MRLVEYIEQRRGEDITKEQADQLLETKHSKAVTPAAEIFRGVDGYGDYIYVDPSKSKQLRVSANTDNYYTLVIDNSPEWKDYPKRSKSLICSTDRGYADSFGEVYRVYPINGAKIGVCPGDDIWNAGHVANVGFEGIANYINNVLRTDPIKVDRADGSYENMVDVFERVDMNTDDILKFMEKYGASYEKYYLPFFLLYLDSGYSFMEFIEWLLDPKLCRFKHVITGQLIPFGREVWVDSPCVLIKQ